MGFGRFVSEGEESEQGVLGVTCHRRGGLRVGGGASGKGVEGGQFVTEFEDDSFGSLFAQALEFRERGGVA